MDPMRAIGVLAVTERLRNKAYHAYLHEGVWMNKVDGWMKFKAAQADWETAKRELRDAIEALTAEELGVVEVKP
jgi:hypothetical protein